MFHVGDLSDSPPAGDHQQTDAVTAGLVCLTLEISLTAPAGDHQQTDAVTAGLVCFTLEISLTLLQLKTISRQMHKNNHKKYANTHTMAIS